MSKRIVGYFGSWSVYRPDDGKFEINMIDPTLCTHLIYTFVGLGNNNDIRVLDPWADLSDGGGKGGFNKFNELRKKSPSTKTLIAIGGWNEGSAKYSQMANTDNSRKQFAKNAVEFVKKYNFDGLDIDWEYPGQRGGNQYDVKNYIELLKEIRIEFDKAGLILSAAVAAAESSASQSYDIPEMCKYLDFINIMTYDLKGSWDSKTGMNAALKPGNNEYGNDRKLNVEACVDYWLKCGAPNDKLNLGVAFYGRTFTLTNKNDNKVGSPTCGPGTAGPYTREAGMLGYNEILEKCQTDKSWKITFDEERCVPYAVNNNQWVSFDNIESIKKKAEFIIEHQLGGAMIWSLETDDFLGKYGNKYPLLSTLNNILTCQ